MTRVAFVAQSWQGGRNYLRNLFAALRAAPELAVEPVLLLGHRQPFPEELRPLDLDVIRSPLFQEGDPRWAVRAGVRVLLHREPWLVRLLARHRIDAFSHSGHLGPRAPIPSLAWIPDFQHRRLPDLFDRRELARRDAWFGSWCRLAARVIVSSEAARADLEAFFPAGTQKARVLHFADCSAPAAAEVPAAALEARYGFTGRYLLLPNQFWVHKNHAVVVEALARLRAAGRRVLVLCTGDPADLRHPGHFPALERRVADLGVADAFRVLGRIPYSDLGALMRGAAALVNPSRFEGWSTTVEESKSLGKRIVLSDIPVHREQAPARGTYFEPSDPAALAEALWSAWEGFDEEEDRACAARAAAELPARRRRFAEDYAAIVREVVSA